MSNAPRTFIDAVIAGDATPDQLEKWFEVWHELPAPVWLIEYLGLTWDEYAAWAEGRATESETVEAAIARRRAERGSS